MVHDNNASTWRRIPASVWGLGFVSLLMDVSSEMIHSLLPLFMVTALHASAFSVGIIEGVAEATALIVKLFSGALSDYLGRRKGLVLVGYGLGAMSKPLFAMAISTHAVLWARMIDRVGKGIRGAPRDALIAKVTPADIRGAAFGLRQALDTVGACLGPVLAMSLLGLWQGDFRSVFWVAVIPGLLSVTVLALAVREPSRIASDVRRWPLAGADWRRLPHAYWHVVLMGAVFTLARFSEAFLVLRAPHSGLDVQWAPMVMVVMNVIYALTAYPFGRLADRIDQRRLLAHGLWVLMTADLLLAHADDGRLLFSGVVLWGIHMGLTQGLLAKLIADTAPQGLLGTAYGLFNLVSGIALLLASVIAGGVWDFVGPSMTFLVGASFAGMALVLLFLLPSPHL